MEECTHLDDLLRAESKIMKNNLENHKLVHHIDNDNDAYTDFIEKYAWLMKEMYCRYSCEDRNICDIAKKYL